MAGETPTNSTGTTLAGATSGTLLFIEDIDWSGMQADVIKGDTLESKISKKAAGQVDPGELTLNLIYHKSVADKLFDGPEAAAEVWTLTAPDGATLVGTGFVSQAGLKIAVGQFYKQPVKITYTSKPTFTPGA